MMSAGNRKFGKKYVLAFCQWEYFKQTSVWGGGILSSVGIAELLPPSICSQCK